MHHISVILLFCCFGLNSVIRRASTIMIGRSALKPSSMKTTPRLFERVPQRDTFVAVFIEGGGHDTSYQDCAKDGYSSVPPGPCSGMSKSPGLIIRGDSN